VTELPLLPNSDESGGERSQMLGPRLETEDSSGQGSRPALTDELRERMETNRQAAQIRLQNSKRARQMSDRSANGDSGIVTPHPFDAWEHGQQENAHGERKQQHQRSHSEGQGGQARGQKARHWATATGESDENSERLGMPDTCTLVHKNESSEVCEACERPRGYLVGGSAAHARNAHEATSHQHPPTCQVTDRSHHRSPQERRPAKPAAAGFAGPAAEALRDTRRTTPVAEVGRTEISCACFVLYEREAGRSQKESTWTRCWCRLSGHMQESKLSASISMGAQR
jgi:hypothetical protein